jgi:hypothetical protein
MREVCAHTKACLARLSEYRRRVFGLLLGLDPDVLRRRYWGVVENVMAFRQDAVRSGAPVPEPPVEIPVTGDLGLLPKERQNLLDIVDPKVVRRSAYRRRALRPADELAARQPVQECCQAVQIAQPQEMETQRLGPRQVAMAELRVVRRKAQLRVSPLPVLFSELDERQLAH